MISPIARGISVYRYNLTLHGRSVYRKQDVSGHNVILGWLKPGTGDALDVFAPAGDTVFAMHPGRVQKIVDRGGRLSAVYVAGAGITTVYAHLHIRDDLKLGEKIDEGEKLGWIGKKLNRPHLHLEVWKDGKSISAPTPGKLAAKIVRLIEGGN